MSLFSLSSAKETAGKSAQNEYYKIKAAHFNGIAIAFFAIGIAAPLIGLYSQKNVINDTEGSDVLRLIGVILVNLYLSRISHDRAMTYTFKIRD